MEVRSVIANFHLLTPSLLSLSLPLSPFSHTHISHFPVDSDYKVLLMDMMDLVRDWASKESLHNNYYIFNSVNFFVYLCSCVLHLHTTCGV